MSLPPVWKAGLLCVAASLCVGVVFAATPARGVEPAYVVFAWEVTATDGTLFGAPQKYIADVKTGVLDVSVVRSFDLPCGTKVQGDIYVNGPESDQLRVEGFLPSAGYLEVWPANPDGVPLWDVFITPDCVIPPVDPPICELTETLTDGACVAPPVCAEGEELQPTGPGYVCGPADLPCPGFDVCPETSPPVAEVPAVERKALAVTGSETVPIALLGLSMLLLGLCAFLARRLYERRSSAGVPRQNRSTYIK